VARTRYAFWRRPYPARILLGAILGTQAIAASIVGFGWLVPKIPWLWVGYVWAYCIFWIFIEDAAKMMVYRHMALGAPRHRRHLGLVGRSLHAHGHRR